MTSNQVEEYVRNRETRKAHLGILQLLKEHGVRSEVLFQCCEWLRRLGKFEEAFRILGIQEELRKKSLSTRTFDGRRLLMGAHYLNLLGAVPFALDLIKGLELSNASDYRIVGGIFLYNFDYEPALLNLKKSVQLEKDKSSYSARLGEVSLADCYALTGDIVQAIKIIRKISKQSSEPLLHGICLQAEGEYLARQRSYSEGLQTLEKAEPYFPSTESTVDRAFLLKWKAYCQAHCGKQKEAQANFEIAESILKQPGYREEMRMDLLRLKKELGLTNPSDNQRLAHYPGLAPGLKKIIGGTSQATLFGSNSSLLFVDVDANEYREGSTLFLGIPLELKLASILRSSEGWGTSKTRLKTLLWPNEVYSYPQLENRLFQLLSRLKEKYNIHAKSSLGVLNMDMDSFDSLGVSVGGSSSLPSFLLTRKAFQPSELTNYYSLKRSQSFAHIKTWREKNWIQRIQGGPQASFAVSPSIGPSVF